MDLVDVHRREVYSGTNVREGEEVIVRGGFQRMLKSRLKLLNVTQEFGTFGSCS